MYYDDMDEVVFAHTCQQKGCNIIVRFDDEPFCTEHAEMHKDADWSGYSARLAAMKKQSEEPNIEHRNVFDI